MATKTQLDVMARHYVIACIWADAPENTSPRVTGAALAKARETCTRFVDAIGPLFDAAMARNGYGRHPDCGTIEPGCAAMGHDLYLTSAGHGVGFWDRKELGDELGAALSEFCGWRKTIPEPCPQFYRGWLYL